jgi:hypothetical protein
LVVVYYLVPDQPVEVVLGPLVYYWVVDYWVVYLVLHETLKVALGLPVYYRVYRVYRVLYRAMSVESAPVEFYHH